MDADEKKPTVVDKIYDEILAGNPLIIVAILFVILVLVGGWVWGTVLNSGVRVQPPKNRHSNITTIPFFVTRTPTPAQGGLRLPETTTTSTALTPFSFLASVPVHPNPFSR